MHSLVQLFLISLLLLIRSENVKLQDVKENRSNSELSEKSPNSVNEVEKYDDGININCIKDSLEKQNELSKTFDILKKSDEEIEKLTDLTKNTILVLGNAGCGKTTFTQFIAGDNDKLMGLEVRKGTEEYIIVDGFRISSSPVESKTIYPEQIKINSNESITDTPGFKDTRSPSHELAESYIMKNYLKNIKNVKIVLLVTYHSLQYGVYKDDFIDLLRYVNNFIKDIDLFKKSMGLIATKVPTSYKVRGKSFDFVTDENIILGISDYLNEVKHSIKEKINAKNNNDNERLFLENAIKIIENLVEVDESKKPKRINIFRRPTESGSLSNMKILQNEKKSIQNTLFNNLEYSELNDNEIGYTLSDSAKIYLNCLFHYINEKIDDISTYTFELIKNDYESRVKNYFDIYQLHDDLNSAYKKSEELRNSLELTKDFKTYISTVENFLSDENLKLMPTNLKSQIYEVNSYMNTLQQFTRVNTFSSITASEKIKPLMNFLKESMIWYNSLLDIFNKLSSYENLDLKFFLHNMTGNLNLILYPHNLMYSETNGTIELMENDINVNSLSKNKKQEIDEILSLTINENEEVTCNSSGVLMVQATFIKLSSIVKNVILKKYCGEVPINVIILHAAHTIYIDTDMIGNEFNGVYVMIAASKWEVIGQRKIVIDGRNGEAHNQLRANDGINFGEDGLQGIPGLPGSDGGKFLGIGLIFNNIQNLLISAKGGNGGPGQHGGNGAKGRPGKNGYEKFNGTEPKADSYDKIWKTGYKKFPSFSNEKSLVSYYLKNNYCRGRVETYERKGECGEPGGKGGYGGIGGIGGYPGEILLLGDSAESVPITKDVSAGNLGQRGNTGATGEWGHKGAYTTCYKLYYDVHEGSTTTVFWICSNITDNSTICSNQRPFIQSDILDFPSAGIHMPTSTQPTPLETYDSISYYDKFEFLLKQKENNKFLARYVTKFKNQNFKSHISKVIDRFLEHNGNINTKTNGTKGSPLTGSENRNSSHNEATRQPDSYETSEIYIKEMPDNFNWSETTTLSWDESSEYNTSEIYIKEMPDNFNWSETTTLSWDESSEYNQTEIGLNIRKVSPSHTSTPRSEGNESYFSWDDITTPSETSIESKTETSTYNYDGDAKPSWMEITTPNEHLTSEDSTEAKYSYDWQSNRYIKIY